MLFIADALSSLLAPLPRRVFAKLLVITGVSLRNSYTLPIGYRSVFRTVIRFPNSR